MTRVERLMMRVTNEEQTEILKIQRAWSSTTEVVHTHAHLGIAILSHCCSTQKPLPARLSGQQYLAVYVYVCVRALSGQA